MVAAGLFSFPSAPTSSPQAVASEELALLSPPRVWEEQEAPVSPPQALAGVAQPSPPRASAAESQRLFPRRVWVEVEQAFPRGEQLFLRKAQHQILCPLVLAPRSPTTFSQSLVGHNGTIACQKDRVRGKPVRLGTTATARHYQAATDLAHRAEPETAPERKLTAHARARHGVGDLPVAALSTDCGRPAVAFIALPNRLGGALHWLSALWCRRCSRRLSNHPQFEKYQPFSPLPSPV